MSKPNKWGSAWSLSSWSRDIPYGYVIISRIGNSYVSVPIKDLLDGPQINWKHIDGPMIKWAGELEWLSLWERFLLYWEFTTVDKIACKLWPHLANARERYKKRHV